MKRSSVIGMALTLAVILTAKAGWLWYQATHLPAPFRIEAMPTTTSFTTVHNGDVRYVYSYEPGKCALYDRAGLLLYTQDCISVPVRLEPIGDLNWID